MQECKDAVNDMKHNKSPGLDGIPNEFYQTFWNDLDDMFYGVLRELFEKNEMSFSQRLSVISLSTTPRKFQNRVAHGVFQKLSKMSIKC